MDRHLVGVSAESDGQAVFESRRVNHGRAPSGGVRGGERVVTGCRTPIHRAGRRSRSNPSPAIYRSAIRVRSSVERRRRARSRSTRSMASAGSPSPCRSRTVVRSTTGRRRPRRSAWRASFAAIATSQARTWAGSRKPAIRRHAIDHAAWTASLAVAGSPTMTKATRVIDAWCSATRIAKADSSPSAARRTTVSILVASRTAMSVMSGRCPMTAKCPTHAAPTMAIVRL